MKKLETLIKEAEDKYLEEGIDKFSERQKIAIKAIADKYAKQAFNSGTILTQYDEYLEYLDNLTTES